MTGNICTRCGNLRVAVNSYQEVTGNSTVTYTIMKCSNLDCQLLVDKNLQAEDLKRKYIKDAQIERELIRQRGRRKNII